MRVPLAKPACLIALVAIGVMCSRQAEARFVMGIGAASCGSGPSPILPVRWGPITSGWLASFPGLTCLPRTTSLTAQKWTTPR